MPNPFGLISEESFNSKMTDISNGLIAINDTLKKSFIPSSWDVLQQKVRSNDMADINLGDEIISSYNEQPFTWTIVGKNADTSLAGNSLTLLSKSLLSMTIIYNHEWCIYECINSLSAGKYRITLNLVGANNSTTDTTVKSFTFYFTLTKPIPAGGAIVISDIFYSSWGYHVATLYTRSSRNSGRIESVQASTSSISGTTELNALSGVTVYAKGIPQNYKYLQIRKWLNSKKSANEWWEKIYPGDTTASSYASSDGFMKGLDPDLLNVVGKKYFDNNIADYFYIADYSNYPYMDTDAKRAKSYKYYTRTAIYDTDGKIITVKPDVSGGITWSDYYRFAIMCNIM